MSETCALCHRPTDSEFHRSECLTLRAPEDGWNRLAPVEVVPIEEARRRMR